MGDVSFCVLAFRKLDRVRSQAMAGNQAQQMLNAVEPAASLFIVVDHVPRRLFDVGVGEYLILCFGVFAPSLSRFQI